MADAPILNVGFASGQEGDVEAPQGGSGQSKGPQGPEGSELSSHQIPQHKVTVLLRVSRPTCAPCSGKAGRGHGCVINHCPEEAPSWSSPRAWAPRVTALCNLQDESHIVTGCPFPQNIV